jgi:hypothetical protein
MAVTLTMKRSNRGTRSVGLGLRAGTALAKNRFGVEMSKGNAKEEG